MKKIRLAVAAIASLLAVSACFTHATTLTEDFAGDPLQNGWQVFGNTNLFAWNATNENLEVTWDSSQTNSYFCHPLGVTLTTTSNFMVAFDLQISDEAITGYGFEMALGLFNHTNAMSPAFSRATGTDSPNLVEFDCFPDPNHDLDYGPSITAVMTDSVGTDFFTSWSLGGFLGADLPLNEPLHIEMIYRADSQTLHTTITANGQPFAVVPDAYLPAGFQGFNVDTLSVSSYQDGGWGDSILAHGTVKNLFFATPLPVTQIVAVTPGSVQFNSTTNWNYVLERSTDLQTWTSAAPVQSGVEGPLTLADTNAPAGQAFYRVHAERP